MSVENPNLSAPVEPVGNADDVKSAVAESLTAEAAAPVPDSDNTAGAVADDDVLAAQLAGKSREELVSAFAEWLGEMPVQQLRDTAEAVKVAFYKLHRAAVDAARRAFVEQGGAEEEFVPEADPLEMRLKELF